MPYACKKVGSVWRVHKQDSLGKWTVLESSGTHSSISSCQRQVKALYANEPGTKNEAMIELNGIFGADITEDYFDFQMMFADSEEDSLSINITSRGGDFPTAINIFNKIKNAKRKHVVCTAYGVVASAGAYILLAGDEVQASENSVLMFHLPKIVSSEQMSADEMEKKADDLRAFESILITALKHRMGKEKDEDIRDFLAEEKYLTPKEAKKMGLIDKILPFRRRKVDVSNLAVPDEILNFAEDCNRKVEIMDLKEICTKLELQVSDELTEEQIVNSIEDLFKRLKKDNEELAAKLPKTKPTLSAGIVNMVKRSREGDLSSLVSEGIMAPAVKQEIMNIYVTEDAIRNSINEEGEATDGFEKVIDAWRKNGKIINLGGSNSGAQSESLTPLPKETDKKVNPLIANAEARSKK